MQLYCKLIFRRTKTYFNLSLKIMHTYTVSVHPLHYGSFRREAYFPHRLPQGMTERLENFAERQ